MKPTRPTAESCFVVRLQGSDGRQPEQYIGPFKVLEEAQRYRERLEQSSNGVLRAEIAPLIEP